MAKKKLPSIEDALESFRNVMTRSSLSSYVYVDSKLLSKSPKGYSILIIPDQELWNQILNDEEFKSNMTELNPEDPDTEAQKELFIYGEDPTSDGWIEADPEILFKEIGRAHV